MKFSSKDIKVIFSCPLLQELERNSTLRLLENSGCEIREFLNREVILSPKIDHKRIGLVLSGRATVTTPDSGKETLLRFLDPKELFGIANLFSNSPFISIIRAHGTCRILFLSEETVRTLLETDKSFLYRYLEFLSDRIRYLNQKIGYLTAGSAERRLALYLSSFKQNAFSLSTSITSLSELLDVGRASLYRAFDRLTEDGFIQKDGRNIRLLNPEAMLQAYQ